MSLSPSLASLEIPGAEAASGWKIQVVAAALLCSICRQVSSDTVAVLERFSGQAVKTEWWQVLGTQEMLYPDLVSSLLGSVLWFKFEHTGCEETKIILQFVVHFQLPQHKWFVRTVLPKPVHYCCSKLQCSWHFALDQGDTKKFPNFNHNIYTCKKQFPYLINNF